MAQRSQQRSRVPQFGKWNTSEDVAYTVCFDKAREQRGGSGMKVGNPNDPQENPGLHLNGAPKSKFAPPEAYKPRVASEEPRGQSNNPSARKDNAASRTNDSRHPHFQSHGTAYGEPHKRHAGTNNGYDHSAGRSPLHHQAKASGGAAPGSSPGAYGRSRVRADDTPSGGAAVPRFGEWNVNDHASGDGYTTVFNRIKEEKQRRPMAAMSPGQNVHASPYAGDGKLSPRGNPKGCCFPWM
ncbi:RPM1-interacting protein 4-like isoform X1 [Rhodamnia argentea]|uniref:RPM1-interacting protein 4-like isoform X1 n=1 Tax=Rhodamnia argentea TaxID=178133 RepID=A0A8B8QL12_9MYRT|nr:RPM1-interacting protein 4-like isoform X1 [Rhodamnia argentea]